VLNYPIDLVYEAFANPEVLQKWWGPNGFTNTFHEFDLRPNGHWKLTMHGPEKGNYENASVFKEVIPHQLISWSRTTQPYFDMEVGFEKVSDTITNFSFRMIFKTTEECDKIRRFASPSNEENFDRLEGVLSNMLTNQY
jgi:uncharacterized protein YndB with AHSA1/START domain